MKAQIYSVNAGWRRWYFLRLIFPDGNYGWSEFTASNSLVKSIASAIVELSVQIHTYNDIRKSIFNLRLLSRQSSGALTIKAISALENALWDAKARSLNTSVVNIIGGTTDPIDLYWSHFCTTRVRASHHVNKKRIGSYDCLDDICDEVSQLGINTVKTNLFVDTPVPYIYMPGFSKGQTRCSGIYLDNHTMSRLEVWFSSLSKSLPNNCSLAVDLNYNYSQGDLCQFSRILNKISRIEWIELDHENPSCIKLARQLFTSRISTGENESSLLGLTNLLTLNLADIFGLDMQWIGLSTALNAALIAAEYNCNISPHNFNGHLSTFMSASFSACIPNLGLLEYDFDDVPWRDEVFNNLPIIKNGKFHFPEQFIGWGTEPIINKLISHDI